MLMIILTECNVHTKCQLREHQQQQPHPPPSQEQALLRYRKGDNPQSAKSAQPNCFGKTFSV